MWQSGRMYLTRNQAYGFPVPWVRIPPCPPEHPRFGSRGRLILQFFQFTLPEPRSVKTFLLYVATALAEIIGCYLPYLWLNGGKSVWLLVPAALSLAIFAWLLTLNDQIGRESCRASVGTYD